MRSIAHLMLMIGLATGQTTPSKPSELQGYPPEQEDESPLMPKRKIIIEEEGPPPVFVPSGCYYVHMDDLARAAADMKNPALKALISGYVVAFDRINTVENTRIRITPVPLFRDGKFPEPFGIFELNDANVPARVRPFSTKRVRRLEHYEEMMLEDAERLITPSKVRQPWDDAAPRDRAAAAEALAAAAILFYDTARDLSKRRGAGWDKLRADIVNRLAAVRLARLRLAADLKDWSTVRTLGSRMVNLYPGNLRLLEEVYAVRLAEGQTAAKSEELSDLERARELLVEFESRFPGSKNPALETLRESLNQQKTRLFKLAEAAVRAETKEAARLLRTLEAIDPNFPGLHALQGQLKSGYAILMVGVNQLPQALSPITARSDSDKMAVELLFESLIESIPDDALGSRFVPSLAASFPLERGGYRDVRLHRPVDWAGLPQQYFDAADVAGTIRLLKGDYRHTWAAANSAWLAEEARVEEQAALRVPFQGAHPHPLTLFDFKVLPTRWLAARGLKPDDPKFSQNPFGTGPFKCLPGPDGRVSAFVANPGYARRPGRLGQPFIREIRFVDLTKKVNLPAEFKTEQLHLLPDVPTEELHRYSDSSLVGRVNVVTAMQNRRIWTLAVNHQRAPLRSVALRRAIAHSIDRDAILNAVYRSGRTEFHRACSGPFPPECWASPRLPVAPPPLFNRDLASAKFTEANRGNSLTILHIAVPAEDARALRVAEMIKKQIEQLSHTPEGKVSIQVDALSSRDFEIAVYREGRFDLALLPYDSPDDWYPFALAARLDPSAAGPGGRNIGGYLDGRANTTREDQLLAQSLTDIRRHADMNRLTHLAHELHKRFNEAMPFIPLWQLDRHMVVSTKLQISFDGEGGTVSPRMLPATIFTQVGRWKLD